RQRLAPGLVALSAPAPTFRRPAPLRGGAAGLQWRKLRHCRDGGRSPGAWPPRRQSKEES
ncbi:MAG: hypothetical protein J6333_09605, partial [Planctomycetes bacterium]|nr:hypothetical protein [Planctomycetota bacterium]